VQEVLKGDQQAVFFLKPIKPELIKTVSDAKEIMPRKSTYFYPKPPPGWWLIRYSDVLESICSSSPLRKGRDRGIYNSPLIPP